MIIHIPHSSVVVPESDTYVIDPTDEIDRVTDWYTDILFEHDQFDKLVFPYSRVYCDVERFEDDPLNERGNGIYYTKCLDGTDLRREDEEEKATVMKIYKNHHLELANYINQYISYFEKVTIVDAHSYSDEQARYTEKTKTPDFCIGFDDFHTPQKMVDWIVDHIKSNGFTYEINDPFEGTIVPTFFYQKNKNVQSIMIEVNKRLYLTDQFQKNTEFEAVKSFLHEILSFIYEFTES
jgi:N-formylglutamate deformylase